MSVFLKELFGAKPASVTEGGGFEVHVLGPLPAPLNQTLGSGAQESTFHKPA